MTGELFPGTTDLNRNSSALVCAIKTLLGINSQLQGAGVTESIPFCRRDHQTLSGGGFFSENEPGGWLGCPLRQFRCKTHRHFTASHEYAQYLSVRCSLEPRWACLSWCSFNCSWKCQCLVANKAAGKKWLLQFVKRRGMLWKPALMHQFVVSDFLKFVPFLVSGLICLYNCHFCSLEFLIFGYELKKASFELSGLQKGRYMNNSPDIRHKKDTPCAESWRSSWKMATLTKDPYRWHTLFAVICSSFCRDPSCCEECLFFILCGFLRKWGQNETDNFGNWASSATMSWFVVCLVSGTPFDRYKWEWARKRHQRNKGKRKSKKKSRTGIQLKCVKWHTESRKGLSDLKTRQKTGCPSGNELDGANRNTQKGVLLFFMQHVQGKSRNLHDIYLQKTEAFGVLIMK